MGVEEVDVNNDGEISFEEIMAAANINGIDTTQLKSKYEIMNELDKDFDGKVSYEEFKRGVKDHEIELETGHLVINHASAGFDIGSLFDKLKQIVETMKKKALHGAKLK